MPLHVKTFFPATLLYLSLALAACGLPVEKVPLQDPPLAPEDSHPSPIGFNKIRFAIPTGTPTLSQSAKGMLGIFTCDIPYGLRESGAKRGRLFPPDAWREIFQSTMESQGYDVAGDPGRLFDEVEDMQRTLYSVGGRITDIKMDTCSRRSFWLGIPLGQTGESYVEVEWSIFDLLTRKTVLKITTKGYSSLRSPNYEGIQLLFEDALASSIHNLGADKRFHNLVFYGEMPKNPPESFPDPDEEPDPLFDPQESVSLPARPVSSSPVQGRLEDIVKSAVLIQAGHSHGSGFFITKQGHILTNAHVVGNASRVRVVTSGKKEKLVAEVLRVRRKRDVALLRLEDVPDDLDIQTLPVRLDEPVVGEDVYAIGAPRLTKLQDTVTKGIVSAHRYHNQKKQYYIQADVDIYGGNSGGPLLDKNGNLIGLSVEGFTIGSGDIFGGLNWFIPIKDALDKLGIGIGGIDGEHEKPALNKNFRPLSLAPETNAEPQDTSKMSEAP